MSTEHDQVQRDPFCEFITQSLDLKAIEALDSTGIMNEVRSLFNQWMFESEELSPSDYLDEAQENIRNALSATLAESSIIHRSELANADPQAIEWLIRLSVTLAFALQAEMADRTPSHDVRPDDDFEDARALRRMLMISMVYARRAALQDDPIAHRIVDDAEMLLDRTERLR